MDEQRGLSKRLQRAGHILILLCVILAGSVFYKGCECGVISEYTKRIY